MRKRRRRSTKKQNLHPGARNKLRAFSAPGHRVSDCWDTGNVRQQIGERFLRPCKVRAGGYPPVPSPRRPSLRRQGIRRFATRRIA